MSGKASLVLLVIVGIFASMSVFRIDEREKAIKLQLGEVKKSDYEPGLHFKWPAIQRVLTFDARIQNLDADPELYLTSEKKNVKVDSFVKWRISDVVTYYKSTGGNAQRASDRLSVVIQKGLKDEFGRRTIQQVVSGERAEIMDNLRVSAKDQGDELGLDIIDVRIKRIDLPEEVSQSVYERMAAERKQVAKKFRSEGEEQAKLIRAEADRDQEVILAEAGRDSQKIRGSGDGRATAIYADAFGQNTGFYSLYRSLIAYRSTFARPSDILVLEPKTQFFRYFSNANPEE
jgi:membrane protease subunit HflC